MAYTISAYTLGCKVSQYESEAILEEAERRGFIAVKSGIADVYVVNTCTVTAEGDRKCRQLIRRLAKEAPEAKIIVCGCYSQVAPDELSKIDCIDYICGTQDKLKTVDRAIDLLEGRDIPRMEVSSLDGATFEKMQIHHAPRTRAYVKIEDGCENRCAYCKIPEARGNVRSKLIADAIEEIRILANGGVKEVVLTGIETASFGVDSGESLADLLDEADKIDGIERIRLGSLEPTLMRPAFIEKIAKLKKLTPHFHLSMQSGCSRTLAAMKRKYNADMALKNIEAVRAAIDGVQFTTDFIVGFPGESDEDFAITCDFVKKARFLQAHIFKYSKRSGTLAATMKDQVPEEAKHKRSQVLTSICKDITAEILKEEIEKRPVQTVLFEQKSNGVWCGHTSSFIEVHVNCNKELQGAFAKVRFTGSDGEHLIGELL
ncbi:MAG: tRNA (N(6)-L-threonylcarbamoyladenosine(37)-C(2))-methylthiotransferase MtaB [Ruminococcaceae bacterium]|nr:tRNA (N(6)-L-threonylcarbamoyladenosine(37)-C(2))-methylthiotransferase MtaB [Oscillospiraceae bacterium]